MCVCVMGTDMALIDLVFFSFQQLIFPSAFSPLFSFYMHCSSLLVVSWSKSIMREAGLLLLGYGIATQT